MNILYTTFVYNELPYIEAAINYYKKEGCDIFIIDNMSNDGTYEWLVENKIKCARFDTNESFDLKILQAELQRHIHKIKPDWVVYGGPDLYYLFDKSIKETIENADKLGYNQLTVRCYGALNTGEKVRTPLYKHYFYGVYYRSLEMISKYDESFLMNGDNIILKEIKKLQVPGIMVNYGACKPIEEQKIKLVRRQKAWDNGLKANIGKHFKSGSLVNWTWAKEKCINFHRCRDLKYFKRLNSEN